MKKYSIIISVYNEINTLHRLLTNLKPYFEDGHELLIIDDGSNDGSKVIIQNCNFIESISLQSNHGKGTAIIKGLKKAKNDRIIIFDGDMELPPSEISKLMILNDKKHIHCVMGSRFNSLRPFKSSFDWGNFIFTTFFNILFSSKHKDILCCAKAFYINNSLLNKLSAVGFEIDVELSAILTINNRYSSIKQVQLEYNRRTRVQGKKLQISDGWTILKKIITMVRFF